MSISTIRIATRQSPLALWQAEYIQQRLEAIHADLTVELVPMTTKGDKILGTPLSKIGGKGLFVKELEQAMLEDRADIAVHSMKDVPYKFPDGLELKVICEREDPSDAFVSNNYHSLDDLPVGATVGTSSLRRKVQIMALRPDLKITDLRGNVGTRLSKLDMGQYDAIILASAGLIRLKLGDRIASRFQPEQLLPAPGQGAVGIEARTDSPQLDQLLAPLQDNETAARVKAERVITQTLQASCSVPIAAFSTIENDVLSLRALVGGIDNQMIEASADGSVDDAEAIGKTVAESLLAQGAKEMIAALGTDTE